MRLLPVLLASIGALGIAAAAAPARAEWDGDDGWRHQQWHERQEQHRRDHEEREHAWRDHEWRDRQRQSYYAAPPVIYSPPPAYSYAPPAYYAPPRPIYQDPGVSIGFGFGFR